MEKIYENSFGKAFYEKENKIVHESYSGVVNPGLAMEVIQSVKAFSENNTVLGDIINLTDVRGTFTGINEYLSKEFFPILIKRGCVAFAMVLSNDIFTEFAANSLVKKLGAAEVQLFNNLNEGEKWVHNCIENIK
jgi:hypothetical protein